MATKAVKKKSPAKAAPEVVSKSSDSSKSASVIPFAPLAGMTNPNLCNFNQPIPSFEGAYETMETLMANYKNQQEDLTNSVTASLSTLANRTKDIIETLTSVAQESGQRNAEAIKSLMASRTLNEYAEAQNKLAQQNFDDAMSTMTKLSEMTIKLYTEAFEPVNAQMTKAMSSVMKKNAA